MMLRLAPKSLKALLWLGVQCHLTCHGCCCHYVRMEHGSVRDMCSIPQNAEFPTLALDGGTGG